MADFKPGDRIIITYDGEEHRAVVTDLGNNGVFEYVYFEPTFKSGGWAVHAVYCRDIRHDVPLSSVEQAAADYCKAILHGR